MKEIIFRAKRIRTGKEREITFEIPKYAHDAVWNLARICAEKGDFFKVRLAPPDKPRSTGKWSQNHHLNGHCQQIAQETGNDFDVIKWHVKKEAVGRGYPYKTGMDGDIIPQSETDATIAECAILIESAHQLAIELGIPLKEDDFEDMD